MNTDEMMTPVSFRVIGVGKESEEIIDRVRAFGFGGVTAEMVDTPFKCVPSEGNQMVIIVALSNEEQANRIARGFHEDGVLTIGLSGDADSACYDCVLRDADAADYPDIIRALLMPLVADGYIHYDFIDQILTFRNSGFFMVKQVIGGSVDEAVAEMQNEFEAIDFEYVESLTVHLYFNRDRSVPIEMREMVGLSDMLSALPASVGVVWSVHFDDTLTDNQIRLVSVLSGKEVWRCSPN